MLTSPSAPNYIVEDSDFWRNAALGAGAVITSLGAILLKIATFFLKKRNDKLDELEKRVEHIEKCLTVIKYDGSNVPLSTYVQQMYHDFSKADERYSNILSIVLTLQEDVRRKN